MSLLLLCVTKPSILQAATPHSKFMHMLGRRRKYIKYISYIGRANYKHLVLFTYDCSCRSKAELKYTFKKFAFHNKMDGD